jgi:hypothetical protein
VAKERSGSSQSRKKRSRGRGSSDRGSSQRNGRQSSSRTHSPEDYLDYEVIDPADIDDELDVILNVPVVKVDKIGVDIDHLRAAVSVRADLQDLVSLNVGAAAHLGNVELNIEGVEAQAVVKARLDNVSLILGRVLTTLDRNPELLESVGRSVKRTARGARGTLEGTGGALGHVGQGGKEAVRDVGEGAGQAAGQVGEGAGKAAGQIGEGAGQLAGGLGGQEQGGQQGQGGGQGKQRGSSG